MKKARGITLVALVVTIIIMLILAGVSLNAIGGDSGLIANAQIASLASKFAKYKEEFEMNIIKDIISTNDLDARKKITLLGEYVKKYIPSLEDQDVGKFAVIEGELYYIDDDKLGKKAAITQKLSVIPDGIDIAEYLEEIEEKAIDAVVKNLGGNSFTSTDENGNSSEVGIKLLDKNIKNTKWKIITEIKDKKTVATYGTGWTYVESGSVVDGLGELKHGYIIDFENRKKVKFDGNKHSMLSWDSSLAVADGLIFSMDPSVIESGKQGDNSWADDIGVYGYNDDYSDVFTKTGMNFDGEDDYLLVEGNINEVTKKGFTYEFYGRPTGLGKKLVDITDKVALYDGKAENVPQVNENNDRIHYLYTKQNNDGRYYQYYSEWQTGILSFGDNMYGSPRTLIKFLFRNDSTKEDLDENQIGNIYFNYGYGSNLKVPKLDENGDVMHDEDGNIIMVPISSVEYYNEVTGKNERTCDTLTPWATYLWVDSPPDTWNQCLNLTYHGMKRYYGDEMYYSIVIDPIEDKQKVYVDGKLVASVQLNTNAWKNLVQELENKKDGYWFVGKATEGTPDWNMFKGEIYTIRIYERALTDTEELANYNASVSYHEFLENGGNAETGGDTGGEDF